MRSTCQIYIEGIHEMSTQEYSRRLGKTPPKRWGPPAIGQGWAPTLLGAATQRSPPIRVNLTDPASTAFEE